MQHILYMLWTEFWHILEQDNFCTLKHLCFYIFCSIHYSWLYCTVATCTWSWLFKVSQSPTFKETVHPKGKVLSSFVMSTLYDFLSVEHKRLFKKKGLFSNIIKVNMNCGYQDLSYDEWISSSSSQNWCKLLIHEPDWCCSCVRF